jgi:hypothetical protein
VLHELRSVRRERLDDEALALLQTKAYRTSSFPQKILPKMSAEVVVAMNRTNAKEMRDRKVPKQSKPLPVDADAAVPEDRVNSDESDDEPIALTRQRGTLVSHDHQGPVSSFSHLSRKLLIPLGKYTCFNL